MFYTHDCGCRIRRHRLPPGKRCGYEEELNLPLIIRGPRTPRGSVTGQVTSHSSLVPTIFDLVWLEFNDDFNGAVIKLNEDEMQESLHTSQEHVNLEYWVFALAEGRYGFREGEAEGINVIQLRSAMSLLVTVGPHGDEVSVEQHLKKLLRLISTDHDIYYSVWCNNQHDSYDLSVS